MWTKRILILLPIVVVAVLLQSYFWVPNFERQAEATPTRLSKYITSSIADAQVLNPILSSDTASSQITDLVFDGLIDRDKDLNFRGRLAESWEISEEAYLSLNPEDPTTPEEMIAKIMAAKESRKEEASPIAASLRNIVSMELSPAAEIKGEVSLPVEGGEKDANGQIVEEAIFAVSAKLPPRVKITLKEVDQDLFAAIEDVVGAEYFEKINHEPLVQLGAPVISDKAVAEKGSFEAKRAELTQEVAPVLEHNPIIVFHLRKGVKFHDGDDFDSADVKFTYEALVNPETQSPRISDYEPVKSVETPDRWTVRVIYKRLYSPAFGSWGMGMLPSHLLSKEKLAEEAEKLGVKPETFTMMQSKFSRHPIGTGAFIFEDWKSDEFIMLKRNEDYWEGAPEYKEYLFRIMPDQLSQELEFYAGAVDGYSPTPIQVDRMKKDDRFQSFDTVSYSYDYIGYNMRKDKFKDPRVRLALSMALDVEDMIRNIYYNQAERTTGPFAKPIPAYNKAVEPPPFDPEGALKLFEEAGWKRDTDGWLKNDKGEKFSFNLMTNNGNDIRRDISTIAQESWKRLGIDVSIQQVEWTKFLDQINTGDFDACVLGWSMGVDPDLYQLWHSSQTKPKMLNFVGYANKEADDLIIRIRQEYNDEKQTELCHRLHKIIADDQPYTFLTVRKGTYLLDRRIFTVRFDEDGKVSSVEKIKASKTGNFFYDFNHWLKFSEKPEVVTE